MKKIISIILCLTMLFGATLALTSCQKKGKTLAEVQEAGKLVVATSPDFPPFENLEGGEVVGIEIDIILHTLKLVMLNSVASLRLLCFLVKFVRTLSLVVLQ